MISWCHMFLSILLFYTGFFMSFGYVIILMCDVLLDNWKDHQHPASFFNSSSFALWINFLCKWSCVKYWLDIIWVVSTAFTAWHGRWRRDWCHAPSNGRVDLLIWALSCCGTEHLVHLFGHHFLEEKPIRYAHNQCYHQTYLCHGCFESLACPASCWTWKRGSWENQHVGDYSLISLLAVKDNHTCQRCISTHS